MTVFGTARAWIVGWLIGVAAGNGSGSAGLPTDSAGVARFHHENVLGTSMELKVFGATELEATRAESVVLATIDRLAERLSAYDPDSEVSRWLRTSGVPVALSSELFEVLGLFDAWRTRTDGALNATAEGACALWRLAAAQRRVPTDAELAKAVAGMAQTPWRLEPEGRLAIHLSSTPIRLNSLAKSYIIQRAVEAVLSQVRVEGIVLNIGGDLVVRGTVPESVAIVDPADDADGAAPADRIRVRDRAVATSGTYRRGVEIEGRWYSHIVDPRNGRPVAEVASATVVSPNAVEAGALATAFCVLSPAESLRLAEATPGVDCLLIGRDGRRWSSAGWNRWQVTETSRGVGRLSSEVHGAVNPGPTGPSRVAGTAVWDPAFEVAIQLELARIEDPRYRRPFVAVWIEDKDKVPVRTVALWFHGPRWLPDLRSWYKGDQLRLLADPTDLTASVSSATRSPGRYSMKWDGKDDAGAWVKPGKYTILLEAAREHGSYQLIRHETEFPAKPGKTELKGNAEITSASVEYRRKVVAP